MVFLNTGVLSGFSLFFNFVGAFILVCALFPPFLDVRKSKKTFAISERFFYFYTVGALLLAVNSVVNLVNGASGAILALFIVFLVTNTISFFMNGYMLMVKRCNMSEAAKRNISEQEYYETVLSKEAAR